MRYSVKRKIIKKLIGMEPYKASFFRPFVNYYLRYMYRAKAKSMNQGQIKAQLEIIKRLKESHLKQFLFNECRKDNFKTLKKNPRIYVNFLIKKGVEKNKAINQAINDFFQLIKDSDDLANFIEKENFNFYSKKGKDVSEIFNRQEDIITNQIYNFTMDAAGGFRNTADIILKRLAKIHAG